MPEEFAVSDNRGTDRVVRTVSRSSSVVCVTVGELTDTSSKQFSGPVTRAMLTDKGQGGGVYYRPGRCPGWRPGVQVIEWGRGKGWGQGE